ncbi:hypothetical protein TNCV_1698821 [Trichonephila clavipes]|nr:hypothetical protein TNCV_1698821 [Trichonephila clavipes]
MHQIPLQSVERPVGHRINTCLVIILMKGNYLPSEPIFSFFGNSITNFDYHIAVHCTIDSLSAFQGQTLNLDIYYQQLDRLKLVTDQKWPELTNRGGVVFHLDAETPHTSVVIRQKLWELD